MVPRWADAFSCPTPRAWALALTLLVLLFSGCTDPPPGPDDGDGSPGPGTPRTPGAGTDAGPDAPEWSVGDHWTYTPTQGEPTELVVVDETAEDWIIGTDSRDLAFFHAQEEVSTLGAQRKSDLAGSQGSERVRFFEWPLADGATWTTQWDGVERTVTATAQPDDTWRFEAREGDNITVRYSYDPAVRWFTTLEFLGGDGQVAFGWQLTDHGQNWTGETYTWDLQPILRFEEGSTIAYSTEPTSFDVPQGSTDVWATFSVGCTTGIVVIGVHPVPWDAGAAGRRWHEPCDGAWTFTGSLGHLPGTWNADFAWQDVEQGAVSGEVYIRSLQTQTVG